MKNNLRLTELCKREMARVIGGDKPCACACSCSCSNPENNNTSTNSTGNSASGSGRDYKPDPAKA